MVKIMFGRNGFCAWRSSEQIKSGFFIRVFGYGLHVMNSDGYVKLFSERYGYKKAYYALGLRFQLLTRIPE